MMLIVLHDYPDAVTDVALPDQRQHYYAIDHLEYRSLRVTSVRIRTGKPLFRAGFQVIRPSSAWPRWRK
jgi:hypothetical protein